MIDINAHNFCNLSRKWLAIEDQQWWCPRITWEQAQIGDLLFLRPSTARTGAPELDSPMILLQKDDASASLRKVGWALNEAEKLSLCPRGRIVDVEFEETLPPFLLGKMTICPDEDFHVVQSQLEFEELWDDEEGIMSLDN